MKIKQKYTSRQIQIINNAIELIGTKGIQGLTIKTLSEKTGIVESAIYRHFKSKHILLDNTLNYLKEYVINNFRSIEKLDLSSTDKLKMLYSKQLESFTKNPSYIIVLLSDGIYKNNAVLRKIIYSIMQEAKQKLTKIFESGIKKGEIRNDIESDQMAFIFMASMRLIVTQWGLSDFGFDLNKKGERLWKTLNRLLINNSKKIKQ
jgi:AcrR family transcriptional regulator